MKLDVRECAAKLKDMDNICIYSHRDPDGDTIGCAMALCDSLKAMGKTVSMKCISPIPENLKFIYRSCDEIDADFNVSVDVSTSALLGKGWEDIPIDLCIDHHISNTFYAKDTCLYTFSSAGELVFDVLSEMKAPISPYGATCLYGAVSSDTGSFKYSGVTSKTMRTAASLLDLGADSDMVRKELYESDKKSKVMVEAMALSSMEYYCGDKIAVVSIPLSLMEKAGAKEEELDGIASLPVKVKGVDIGITLKEKEDGSVRVSVRTTENADACKICSFFGGGGHVRASGCRIDDTMENAKNMLLKEAEKQVL